MDGASLESYGYNELAAGHIDSDLPAADFTHQGQGGDNAAGSRAAGIGKVLHAPLEGALKDLVLTGELAEVDVSSLGEFRIEADLASKFTQNVIIGLRQIGIRDHSVGESVIS